MAEWLTTWTLWHWLVLGFVLLIVEIMVPGVFLLWWGLAALGTALVQFLIPAFSLTAMLGKRGSVQEIASNGIGRGVFGDTTWRIQGECLRANDLIEVKAVSGITLIVQKVTE